MKHLLYAFGILLIGVGGGLVVEETLIQYPYIGWWVLAAGILLVISVSVYEPIRKAIAAPILDWEFTTNYSTFPEKVFFEGRRKVFWEGQEPQRDGDFYKLDMRKERVISGVFFDHGSSNKVPKTWQVFFFDGLGAYVSPYRTDRPPHISGQDSILLQRLERSVKAQYILVRITEPRMENGKPYKWAIESIKMREKRLWGLWHHIIGEL